MNIYSDEIASYKISGHIAKSISEKQMKDLQHSLIDGFYSTILKKCVSIDKGNWKWLTENVETYNSKFIYSQVLSHLSIDQISLDDLFM